MYEIVERSIDKRGQYLFPADVEINMWDVNVDFSDHDVIALYHAHGEKRAVSQRDQDRYGSGTVPLLEVRHK